MKALVALSAATTLAISATAADRPVRDPSSTPAAAAQARFEALDSDRDGALNKREAKSSASIAAHFDAMDVNLDGFITQPEYVAYTQRITQPQSPRQ
jgi:hypothetical protein